MSRIIALANQKGGVGKTTTCVNLAASLATQKKILIIDMDPQGNATMASGISKFDLKNSIYNILVEGLQTQDVILHSDICGYDVLPANSDLTAACVRLMDFYARETKLKNALSNVKDNYDYIFIDCPPALNLLTVNALCAANSVLVPMQCEYFALEGLTDLIDTIQQIKQINPDLEIEGILRTMYDNRARLSAAVSLELKKTFQDKVYKTIIPRNVRLAEAPSYGKPALYYDKSSYGARAYLALAGEMLSREDFKAESTQKIIEQNKEQKE